MSSSCGRLQLLAGQEEREAQLWRGLLIRPIGGVSVCTVLVSERRSIFI